jgi:hypothetical protein
MTSPPLSDPNIGHEGGWVDSGGNLPFGKMMDPPGVRGGPAYRKYQKKRDLFQ